MAYELTGPSAAPVICLNHCFATDHRFWDLHLPALEGFRVLRYDTRGHGNSDRPPGDYTLDTTEQLTAISQPTLVVAAPEDPGVPAVLSELLAARIPRAELHWLSPARHLATLEHVRTFNQLLRAFLDRVSTI